MDRLRLAGFNASTASASRTKHTEQQPARLVACFATGRPQAAFRVKVFCNLRSLAEARTKQL
jgi:hypothetical protein